jgi:hypothetical protein
LLGGERRDVREVSARDPPFWRQVQPIGMVGGAAPSD